MGICNSPSNPNQKTKKPTQKKTQTQISPSQPSIMTTTTTTTLAPIINRLSEKTIYDDINKYLTLSEVFLGRGATGIVREAHNDKGEKFAVKTVWKSDIEQNEFFKKEIEISLTLNHPSIVKCNSIYEDANTIHFVLQLISGGDLFDHIIHSPNRKLNDNEAMDILEQILQALHYLHDEVGIVHRDIKPENFLMYNDKGRNKIKLIDFGFATYAKNDEFMTEQIGTPNYSAPEIFEDKPYTNKVDIWATGIVLYNMINGMQPFSSNEKTLMDQVLHREIDYSGFSNNNLRDLCKNLLERDSSKRLTAFQALNSLSLIKGGDANQQTIPSSFNPDINKIMFILNNDKALGDELREIFLEFLSIGELQNMYDNLTSNNEDVEQLTGKKYLKAGNLIDFAKKSKSDKNDFIGELDKFIENKGEEKINKKMINCHTFFFTAIESKKFIRKQRALNDFKQFDKKNLGFIHSNQVDLIFKDPVKRKNIKSNYKNKKRIQFEEFYKIFNEYENVVIPPKIQIKEKISKDIH